MQKYKNDLLIRPVVGWGFIRRKVILDKREITKLKGQTGVKNSTPVFI